MNGRMMTDAIANVLSIRIRERALGLGSRAWLVVMHVHVRRLA